MGHPALPSLWKGPGCDVKGEAGGFVCVCVCVLLLLRVCSSQVVMRRIWRPTRATSQDKLHPIARPIMSLSRNRGLGDRPPTTPSSPKDSLGGTDDDEYTLE